MKPFNAMLRIVLFVMLAAAAYSAFAQLTYPNKPIRFILPYAAGGNTSLLARLIGQKMTENWGQQLIVDNRAGGNTIIGTEALAKSPPDGYTILMTTATHTILSPVPYDPINDFAPVATLTSSEKVLVIHPSLPANNLREFIALAKSRPGQLNFSSPGAGGVQHLAGELFNLIAGVKLQHIPYKGGGQAVTDLIGGQVQLSFQNSIAVLGHVRTGKLRAIAVSGETRLPSLPQVPTFAEAGLPGFGVNTWFGILAPARTPREIIDKLATEFARILNLPDIREKLAALEMYPLVSTPDQFAALMKADMAKYAKVIKAANIELQY